MRARATAGIAALALVPILCAPAQDRGSPPMPTQQAIARAARRAAREASRCPGMEPPSYDAGIWRGGARTDGRQPRAPVPEPLVGRTILFASAARLRGRRPQTGEWLAVTSWRSSAELRELMRTHAGHTVFPAAAALIEVLRVPADERVVTIDSSTGIEVRGF